MRVALIDGDILAYECAAGAEDVTDWGDEVISRVLKRELDETCEYAAERILKLKKKVHADRVVICLSDPEHNFRKDILPTYKHNRNPKAKPQLLMPVKEWLVEEKAAYVRPGLEADDVMGILATHPALLPGDKIIVSIDKDMKQIPGWLFNPDKHDQPVWVDASEGYAFWLHQILTGDAVDGYSGLPRVGPVKAAAILAEDCSMLRVAQEYINRGYTFEDFLVQARVARICQWQDYDYKRKEVKLWKPSFDASALCSDSSAKQTGSAPSET